MAKIAVNQKIIPFLWFNGEAEEAVNFYTSIFKKSKILLTNHFGKGYPMPEGSVMTIYFRLGDQEFAALNGGPEYTFSHAISFAVLCKTQDEIDYFWDKLSEGGEKEVCGWLKDKYGVSWQIVPAELTKWLTEADSPHYQQVLKAILHMKKLDMVALRKAYSEGIIDQEVLSGSSIQA